MKYAIIREDQTILKLNSQEELKMWIKSNLENKKYQAIEYQELEVRTELKIDFKRPGASRVS